jgi:hypothetical protein
MAGGKNLPDAANFILEQHGDQVSPSFQTNSLKVEFILERALLWDLPSFRTDLVAALIGRTSELPKTADELDLAKADFYRILGLPKSVSKTALTGSLLLLEGRFKSQKQRRGEGGEEPEKLLNMTRTARSVLLDDNLRAAYNLLLTSLEGGPTTEKGQHLH